MGLFSNHQMTMKPTLPLLTALLLALLAEPMNFR